MPTDSTLTKYRQAVKRITDAGVDLDTGVLVWLDSKNLGESAVKTYLSALKHHMGERFPKEYQEYMFSLLHRQNDRDERQVVPKRFQVTYKQLVDVRTELEKRAPSVELLAASLVTLQPPLRNDYRDMEVHTRADKRRTGNELIWSSKPRFILREYKTKGTYGTVIIPIHKELAAVIQRWFDHLGGVPEYLLGRTYSPTGYIELLQRTFKPIGGGKSISVNATRHAYITAMLPHIATNTKKKAALAKSMLHSVSRQEAYFVHDDDSDMEID